MNGLTPQQVGAPLLSAVQPQQPTPQEILAQLQARSMENIERQKAQAAATQAQLGKVQNKGKDAIDLTPFALAVDALTGSRNAPVAQAMYQQQVAPQREAARLQELLRRQQGAITDDEINLLKTQYKNATDSGLSLEDELKLRNQYKKDIMNTQYDLNRRLKEMGLADRKEREAKKAAEKASKPKEFKRDQTNAATFGRRLEQANVVFDNLASKGYDRTSRLQDLSTWLPKELQGEDLRSQAQAERNFVNAVLRRESGAAIAPHEFTSAEEQYFPRPGDTPAILAQKKANREQALAGLKVGAGEAWEAVPLIDPLTGGSSAMPDFDNMSDEELQQFLGQ